MELETLYLSEIWCPLKPRLVLKVNLSFLRDGSQIPTISAFLTSAYLDLNEIPVRLR